MPGIGAATGLVIARPTSATHPATGATRARASDNRVESERAEFALALAHRGARVAVVSSGDPGYSPWPPRSRRLLPEPSLAGRAGAGGAEVTAATSGRGRGRCPLRP